MYKISCITWSVRFDKWGGNIHSTAGESNNKKYKKMAYNLTKSIKRQLQIRVISNFDRTRPLVIGAISRVFLSVVALIIGFITSWPLHSNSCVCDVVTFRHSDTRKFSLSMLRTDLTNIEAMELSSDATDDEFCCQYVRPPPVLSVSLSVWE